MCHIQATYTDALHTEILTCWHNLLRYLEFSKNSLSSDLQNVTNSWPWSLPLYTCGISCYIGLTNFHSDVCPTTSTTSFFLKYIHHAKYKKPRLLMQVASLF